MKNALACAGAASAGARLLADDHNDNNNNGKLSMGDAALLRFAAAAEILESDFWIQYNELGGVQDSEVVWPNYPNALRTHGFAGTIRPGPT